MKLLSKDLLREYGFSENTGKSSDQIEVMTKDQFDIIIRDGSSFYYSNFGIDYPLNDIAALRKLYKEVRSVELKPVKS